jgi:hypothetical protein
MLEVQILLVKEMRLRVVKGGTTMPIVNVEEQMMYSKITNMT